MSLKDQWKNTGKGLGKAFAGLGKNIGRSVKTGLDAADDSLPEDGSTVFNDGSWRKTGKELGSAFTNLGKSVVKSVQAGLDKIDGDDDEKVKKEPDKASQPVEKASEESDAPKEE